VQARLIARPRRIPPLPRPRRRLNLRRPRLRRRPLASASNDFEPLGNAQGGAAATASSIGKSQEDIAEGVGLRLIGGRPRLDEEGVADGGPDQGRGRAGDDQLLTVVMASCILERR